MACAAILSGCALPWMTKLIVLCLPQGRDLPQGSRTKTEISAFSKQLDCGLCPPRCRRRRTSHLARTFERTGTLLLELGAEPAGERQRIGTVIANRLVARLDRDPPRCRDP